ncbi:MAG: M42 family metallopeptidase [Gemmatimonadetes bacterium]|nr:M42 family metallopeptidase [Gemmatimonadota bacterium]
MADTTSDVAGEPETFSEGSIDFLRRLLDAPGPSGFELAAARVWREEAEKVADRFDADVSGNSFATLNPGGSPRVMLAGHIDEIGLIVTHIDEEGFLYFDGIGGWDAQVLLGQRVRILARDGEVTGVVGTKPIHLMKPEERDKAAKLTDLWVDVGAKNREAAHALGLRVGDPAVLDGGMVKLGGDLIASRAVDNRIGAFVVLETLRILRSSGRSFGGEVTAVATAQEEIGYQGGGARTSAFQIEPQVALVVDVTFATDAPRIEKKQTGEHCLGGGPVLGRGSAIHPLVFDRLVDAAEAAGIAYTIQANARATHTDADAIYLSRAGVATGVISVPNRYMHSPNEIVSLADLHSTARLLAEFVLRLEDGASFVAR